MFDAVGQPDQVLACEVLYGDGQELVGHRVPENPFSEPEDKGPIHTYWHHQNSKARQTQGIVRDGFAKSNYIPLLRLR